MAKGMRNVTKAVGRLATATQNALEVARFGGLETGARPAPFEVVAARPVYRLRRYFPDRATGPARPALLLIPPLMVSTEVYDVGPDVSAVSVLAEAGIDPWVVDFGAPEREEGGLERTLTDHVLAVDDAIDRMREVVGADVFIGGYSQGGMFAYQVAALRHTAGIAGIVTFGSPVDTREVIPLGLPEEQVAKLVGLVADRVMPRWGLPAWATRTGFRLLDPAKTARSRIDFLLRLHDRDALLPREDQRRFLEADGWVAYPAPAISELLGQFVAHNRMLAGGFVIDGRTVTLADIACPMLCFVGEVDAIAPTRAVRAVARAAPRAEVWEVPVPVGHFGLVVGSGATTTTWPTVVEWVRWKAGLGPQPVNATPMVDADDDRPDPLRRVGHAVGLAADVGLSAARTTVAATRQGVSTMVRGSMATLSQLPRVSRLQGIQSHTRLSLGQALDEQAARTPEATFFLFDGRGHTYGDAKRRIDNIVRGLLSVGVRQGEHVGVLMDTRPSAVAVVAALSRLGAVVVLLRPDGDVAVEARLGNVARIIADPDNAEVARRAGDDVPVLVLGGGGEPRELGFGLFDMERIDPDAVVVPGWYRPNPGRARDLAFVLFTGSGASTRANRITNGRWAIGAYGTASAAQLSTSDTVYVVTPLHHPSGLLTGLGGAVAGGARVALTGSFDPGTFWAEVRRYGVTVVTYTWTQLQPLVDAAPDPAERHHPIRLFVGSGMPKGLWQRVLDRFGPASVVEFYASTEGQAVLVNVGRAKPGSKGRRLPGSARVAVAAWDFDAGVPELGDDGFVRRCDDDEVGMLLVEARSDRGGLSSLPQRGVFRPDDVWTVTGDLFRRDPDGDYWIVDATAELVRTAAGLVPPHPVGEAIEQLPAVSMALAYGVATAKGTTIVVAAFAPRDSLDVDPDDLTYAVRDLPAAQRPLVIREVAEIPTSTWHRPLRRPLEAQGVPAGEAAWVWRASRRRYERLTAADRKRLGLPAA